MEHAQGIRHRRAPTLYPRFRQLWIHNLCLETQLFITGRAGFVFSSGLLESSYCWPKSGLETKSLGTLGIQLPGTLSSIRVISTALIIGAIVCKVCRV
jgi:hypothetical protein